MHLRLDGGLLEGFSQLDVPRFVVEYGLGLINTVDRSSLLESAKLALSAKCEVLFLLIKALFGISFIELKIRLSLGTFFN